MKILRVIFLFLLAVAAVLCCGCANSGTQLWVPQTSELVTPDIDDSDTANSHYGYSRLMLEQNIMPEVYTGTFWRIDNKSDNPDLPRAFRAMTSDWDEPSEKYHLDLNYEVSREGLDQLRMSGSAEFDESQLQGMVKTLREYTDGPICVVDLRQESHIYVNGRSLSWYGLNDWGNLGRNATEVERMEEDLVSSLPGSTMYAYRLDDDKVPYGQEQLKADSVQTEKELVTNAGLQYFRLPCTDHVCPTDEEIDTFIRFVRDMDPECWLHFHCEAGKGRTSFFMVLYDMMRNPDLSLQDITYRQHLLGGNYVLFEGDTGWKVPYYAEKAERTRLLYQYVQDNKNTGYACPFSDYVQSLQHSS